MTDSGDTLGTTQEARSVESVVARFEELWAAGVKPDLGQRHKCLADRVVLVHGATMPVLILTALVFLAPNLVGGAARAGDPPDPALRELQGTWVPVGQPDISSPAGVPPPVLERLVFKGDRMYFHYLQGTQRDVSENRITLDPTKTPKRIYFTPTDGGSGGKPYRGVYELRGRRLKITYSGPQDPRPAKIMDRSPNRYEFKRQVAE
jgi:uncharacterized protein (TIGR03067 family)